MNKPIDTKQYTESDWLEKEVQRKKRASLRMLVFTVSFTLILMIIGFICKQQEDSEVQRLAVAVFIIAGLGLLACVESYLKWKKYNRKNLVQKELEKISIQKDMSLESMLRQYIQAEEKEKRRSLPLLFVFWLIVVGIEVVGILHWQDFGIFLFVLFSIGVILFTGTLVWTIQGIRKRNIPEKYELYKILIEKPDTISQIHEILHLNISPHDRAALQREEKLPWSLSTQSQEKRYEMIEDFKKSGAKTIFSIFELYQQNKKRPLTLKVPSQEAPQFAKVLEKRVPRAKFGFEKQS